MHTAVDSTRRCGWCVLPFGGPSKGLLTLMQSPLPIGSKQQWRQGIALPQLWVAKVILLEKNSSSACIVA